MRASVLDHPAEAAGLAGMPEDSLPAGWAYARLGHIAEVNPRKPAADLVAPGTPVTFVPMAAVDEKAGAITKAQVRPFSEVRQGFTAFQQGDVLMAKITPCMENGKAAIARDLVNDLGFGSTEFHVLRSHGAVLPEFLYHFIRQESFRREAEAEMTGSVGQKRVPKEFVEQALIPVPPLPEQHRIVTNLDALLRRLDNCVDRLGCAPAIFAQLRQAVLAAACSGRLTEEWRRSKAGEEPALELLRRVERARHRSGRNAGGRDGTVGARRPSQEVEELIGRSLPNGWAATTLAVLSDVVGGVTKGQKRRGGLRLREVPYLRVANVQRGRLDLNEVKTILASEDEIARLCLRPGDILFTEGGDRDKLGRGWVWSGEIDECIHQNHVFRARLHLEDMQPEFVSLYANGLGARYFDHQGKQTVNLASISLRRLSELPIPLPPITEQREIVQRVRHFLALVGETEQRLVVASDRASATRRSILARAFRGELVPTEAELAAREGRTYEPALELLSRVGRGVRREVRARSGHTLGLRTPSSHLGM